MASFLYTFAAAEILKGNIDFVADDIRVLMVMTNTTIDTEKDKTTISAFTTPDFMDGANNARKALANQAVVADDPNDRGEFDADDPTTWSALGVGARDVQAVLLYKHVTNDTDSVPIAYLDTGGFPFGASGADVDIAFNVEGIMQLATA